MVLPFFAFRPETCYPFSMFFSITRAGLLARVWSLNGHDEVMRHCARVGFKP
jgi:hypothetical protein